MILVFDLDDTLYDELTFVAGGFRAVAAFMEKEWQVPAAEGYSLLNQRLQSGRGEIFDDCLRQLGHFSKRKIGQCLSIYRSHQPDISLYEDAAECLQQFSHYPIYIVTDGNKMVQHSKLVALGLYERFPCYITHRFGIIHAKPSAYCFLEICRREKANPSEVVYFGDNPRKDFVGIKPLGFHSIRLLRGQHKDVIMPPDYEAEYRLNNFTELNEGVLIQLFSAGGR